MFTVSSLLALVGPNFLVSPLMMVHLWAMVFSIMCIVYPISAFPSTILPWIFKNATNSNHSHTHLHVHSAQKYSNWCCKHGHPYLPVNQQCWDTCIPFRCLESTQYQYINLPGSMTNNLWKGLYTMTYR